MSKESQTSGVEQTQNSEYRTKENTLKDANLLCSESQVCGTGLCGAQSVSIGNTLNITKVN